MENFKMPQNFSKVSAKSSVVYEASSFNVGSALRDEAPAFPSHGLLLVVSLLPLVLLHQPSNSEYFLRAVTLSLGNPLPSPAIHLGSYFKLFGINQITVEIDKRCLLKKKILSNHHEFSRKYIKDLEVNITFQSLTHVF